MISTDEKIVKIRNKFGQSIYDILCKDSQYDIYEILGAIEVLVGSKIYKKLPTSASERMIFASTWLAREVQNGGFHQYFFNSAGDFWKDVLNGLILVKDDQGLVNFKKAISIFPDSLPSEDRFARQAQLEKLDQNDEDMVWDHFGKLTNAYFSNPFPNWQLVYNYVRMHPDEFDLQNA